ncbi:hypothetical protein ATANTOWER_001121 [Ataeniobius toweri]|uniref:Uncharacterized protein n=1 Tax=Ataeniobius toweri TaxID=208326 RepID=A0ABU7BZ69_9TELE|nr:hypothetical protein [Ataeniobius toweri]
MVLAAIDAVIRLVELTHVVLRAIKYLIDGIFRCLSAINFSISSVELTPGPAQFNVDVSVEFRCASSVFYFILFILVCCRVLIPPLLPFDPFYFNITLVDWTFGYLHFKVVLSDLSWMDGGIKATFLIICTWNN